MQKGIGYCLIVKGKPASIAFSSFVHEPFYEIGIETTEEFRGNGLAKIVCSELINFLQRNRFNPVWSCRKGNSQSYYLAQKLGFKPSFEIPYYIL
ncbi:MAG: GNAT family N-acetyltransferase [Cytophagaceae bacterium]|nr:GNAT family N-acetyltransferase [Cytophagaceae bacterium]